MKQIKEYELVAASNTTSLVDTVNDLLQAGWSLHGSLVVADDGWLVQPMFRETTVVEDADEANKVLQAVSRATGVPVERIVSKERGTQDASVARMVSAYIMCNNTPLTRAEVGIVLGGRHVTTVRYALEQIANLIECDKSICSIVSEVEASL